MPTLTRRGAMITLGGAALAVPLMHRTALGQNADVSKEMILNDPAAPVAGNPKGDVTIVAFLDYNCPFCKKSAPDLDRVVKEDGKIRLVYKDWPVIRPTSIDGAMIRSVASSLSIARAVQSRWNSSQTARSRRLAPERPVMPRACCAGSKLAKLVAFIATALGVRPMRWAIATISGLDRCRRPNGVRQ